MRLLDGGELSVGQILTAGNGNGLAIVEYSRKVQTLAHASKFTNTTFGTETAIDCGF